MDWVLAYLVLLVCTTAAGAGYSAGWQKGWDDRKSLEAPIQALRKLT